GNGIAQTLSSFNYDAVSHSVSLAYGSLREGNYTLTLSSAADAFRDRAGNLLDGDHDGITGGAFILGFTVDVQTAAYPVPLAALLQSTSISTAGTYTIRAYSAIGAGAYSIDALLNAALETSGVNDAIAAAQDIDASFIVLTGTASRGGVRGTLGSADEDWYRF